MFSEMEQERKRHGYISGLKPPKISDDFIRVKKYIESLPKFTIDSKPLSMNKAQKITKDFYSLLFRLHTVYILPEQFKYIFNNYMDSNAKTTEGFVSLLSRYTRLSSPFNIPVEINDSYYGDATILTYNTASLMEEILPIINYRIVMSTPTELTPCLYAGQICDTQTARIKGIIPNFHDQYVLSILLEKILAYEISDDIFPLMESYRITNLKKYLEILQKVPSDNDVWSCYISVVKAEILFDYYMMLTDNDKKEFFRTIQKIFDGEMSLQELLSQYTVTLESDQIIPSVKRNLSIH